MMSTNRGNNLMMRRLFERREALSSMPFAEEIAHDSFVCCESVGDGDVSNAGFDHFGLWPAGA